MPAVRQLRLAPHVVVSEHGTYRLPVECGYLTVPERRDIPNSRAIELAFYRLRTPAANPEPPLIFLVGGPGGSGTEELTWEPAIPWFTALQARCDVLLFDQRGTGRSRPNLANPLRYDLPLDRALDRDDYLAEAQRLSHLAVQFWSERGVDLRGYTTIESADDINDLRAALGYPQVSLWGASYGSHLALATIRRHGRHIARAQVALVEGPDHTWKLPSNVQRCLAHLAELAAADPAVRKAVPDLLDLIGSVIDGLRRAPARATLANQRGGGQLELRLSAFDLQRATAGMLGWRNALRDVPAWYLAMASGDYRRLAEETLERRRGVFTSAMYWQMDSASAASPARLERIRREAPATLLGDAIDFPFPDIAAAWPAADLGDEFRGPLASDIPTLFISGTLDGRTPPSNVDELLPGFKQGQHLVIEHGEHDYADLLFGIPEVAETSRAFLLGEPYAIGSPRAAFRFTHPERGGGS